MLTSKQIRSSFIDFFKSRGHKFVPSWPVVPAGDETLLFTNAGMNQFKDIFLGLTTADYKSAVNSQKCIRVSGKHNDLEEVGFDAYHHTFFEMLGNWSFNDYFKAEAIQWAWELLTKEFGIDADRLWVTVFAGDKADGSEFDKEAAELWPKVTSISADRVLAFGRKDNFWEMGETGPCGPCSEIHIDLGPERCDKKNVPGHKCAVNGGCARFIELWNLVFIQFNRVEGEKLLPLPAKYVDTGAGLERITAVLQGKKSNYDTDLFMPIIESISQLTGQKYTSQLASKTDSAFRVIADHIRSLIFAITDGVTPSNDGRGYVIRRILRRASRFGRVLGVHQPFMYKLVPVVADVMGDAFAEVKKRADFVSTVIESEEAAFGRTLDRGLEIFNTAADKAAKSKDKTITGDDAFALYDTYGFPLDLTQLMARERSLKVDTDTFETLMQAQRDRGRAAQKSVSLVSILTGVELPVTDDSQKYHTSKCDGKIVALIDTDGYKNKGKLSEQNGNAAIILDKTCFYAESGGQVGDCGLIETANGKFIVEQTEKIADCIIHRGKLAEGTITIGDKAAAIVDTGRESSRKNHTATHLLQWALRQTLGESVHQQGSLVGPDYLRFDFTYPKALADDEIKKVEQLVREKISTGLAVSCSVMPINEAKKLGAMALFNEKYGDEVRVVAIGAEDSNTIKEAFSREFCGGTHVNNTAQIGSFKITREESVSAGVRRITALTGDGLLSFLEQRCGVADELSQLLKTPADGIVERVKRLLDDNKKMSRELKSAVKGGAGDIMAEAKKLLDGCVKIGETSVIIGELPPADDEQMRAVIDMLRKKAGSAAIVLGVVSEGKVTLFVGMTDDVIAKGLKAGDVVKQIAPIVGGGGGGRPQMAQAGGKDPAKLPDALEQAKSIVKAKLG